MLVPVQHREYGNGLFNFAPAWKRTLNEKKKNCKMGYYKRLVILSNDDDVSNVAWSKMNSYFNWKYEKLGPSSL